MNSKTKNSLTIFGIYGGAILLSLIFANSFGLIHSFFFETTCADSIFIIANFDAGCRIEGFIYAFIFWLAIFLFTFLEQKIAWVSYIFGTLLFWLLFIYIIITENLRKGNEIVGSLIIMLVSFAIGYGLAFCVRKFIKIFEQKK